jgi:hypothetical protein
MKKDRRNNRNRFLRKEWRPHMNQDMKKCHSPRRPSGCGALPWLHVLRVGLTPRAQVDELRPPPAARRVLTGSYISGTQRQWINNNSPSPNKLLFHLTQSINTHGMLWTHMQTWCKHASKHSSAYITYKHAHSNSYTSHLHAHLKHLSTYSTSTRLQAMHA